MTMAQDVNLKSRNSASAAASASKSTGGVQGSGNLTSASNTEIAADPNTVVKASNKTAAATKTAVNERSQVAAETTTSNAQAAQAVTSDAKAKAQGSARVSGQPATVKAGTHSQSPEVSIRSGNKSSAALSINGAQLSTSDMPEPQPKKARVKTSGNVSTNSSIRQHSVQSSGFIKTTTGLGLK